MSSNIGTTSSPAKGHWGTCPLDLQFIFYPFSRYTKYDAISYANCQISSEFCIPHLLKFSSFFIIKNETGVGIFVTQCIFTTTTLQSFNGLFSRTTSVSHYQKGKTSLDLNEARDDGVLGYSGISCTIFKQSAPRSREITTPTPHHSTFTGRMLFLTPNQLSKH